MKPNFIIAVTGQSNSQGFGGMYEHNTSEDQPHERVMGWNANLKQWVIASLQDESLGTSDHRLPGMQLFAFHAAKQIAKNDPNKIVGIINYGVGGQEIKHWSKVPPQCLLKLTKNAWDQSPNVLCLKACNDKILCAENNSSIHFTRPVNINFGWEAFCLKDVSTNRIYNPSEIESMNFSNTKVYIYSPYHKTYMHLDGSIVNTVASPSSQCVFTVKTQKIGPQTYITFKGYNNKLLGVKSLKHVNGNMFGLDVESMKCVGVDNNGHGGIYNNHVLRIKEALKAAKLKNVDVIFMHQGEADFDKFGSYYENAIYNTISQYRNEPFCTSTTPFIVGNTCQMLESVNDWWTQRNKQLYKLNVDALENTACVNSVGVEYNLNDPIHFSSEGHRQLGHLYLEKYQHVLKYSL